MLAQRLWGNPAVTRLLHARGVFSPEEIEQRLQAELAWQQEYGMQYWPLFRLDSGEFLGCCGLRPYRPAGQIPEFGIQLLPGCWGQGFGTEAGSAVLRFGFEHLGARKISAGHHPANEASRRLLLRLGFQCVGTEFYPPTGLQHPSYLLERPSTLSTGREDREGRARRED